jgi:hypothetical protein
VISRARTWALTGIAVRGFVRGMVVASMARGRVVRRGLTAPTAAWILTQVASEGVGAAVAGRVAAAVGAAVAGRVAAAVGATLPRRVAAAVGAAIAARVAAGVR